MNVRKRKRGWGKREVGRRGRERWGEQELDAQMLCVSSHFDWESMVVRSCGATGIAALAVDAMMLKYHTAIVSKTVGSASLFTLH